MTQPKKKSKIKKKFEKKAPVECGEVIKEEKKDIDEHPLAIGHYLVVKYRDGSDRLVRVRIYIIASIVHIQVLLINVIFLVFLRSLSVMVNLKTTI
jgi:hypothetical protein